MLEQRLEHVWSPNDDWTAVTAKTERKKRQNRLNQRARRMRNEKKDSETQGPYRTIRWRVKTASSNELVAVPESSSIITSNHLLSPPNSVTARVKSAVEFNQRYCDSIEAGLSRSMLPAPLPSAASPCPFPLSSDHILLHLIHYNFFRAMTSNKAILMTNCSLHVPSEQGPFPLLPSFHKFCDGLTTIVPIKDKLLPEALRPTALQMQRPHSSWLGMFPHARLRNNLIELEGVFDAADLCNDLMGELFKNYQASPSPPSNWPKSKAAERDVAADRSGMIVWSEPWDTNSWEITPGFLKKWCWLLKGCEDLIKSSNRWRAKRNEEPLRMDVELGTSQWET